MMGRNKRLINGLLLVRVLRMEKMSTVSLKTSPGEIQSHLLPKRRLTNQSRPNQTLNLTKLQLQMHSQIKNLVLIQFMAHLDQEDAMIKTLPMKSSGLWTS
jgi:hypothetical protein